MTTIEKIIQELRTKFLEKDSPEFTSNELIEFVTKAYQAGLQDGREEVLKKAKKLHYEYLKGIKVRETLPAKLAEIYTLGIDDYYHFLSSKE